MRELSPVILSPHVREAIEHDLALRRAEQRELDEARRRADRPVYMYEADAQRFTIGGVQLSLLALQMLVADKVDVRFQDVCVSNRGLRYLLDDTRELRERWAR